MKKEIMNVGIIGCGNISAIYLTNLGKSKEVRVSAVADLVREKAEEQAKKFSVPAVMSVNELLKNRDVDIVLNLTIPVVHGKIALEALRNGKHVYNEKPLSIDLAEARAMVALAKKKKLRVGCAPDTFLGGGWQHARKIVDSKALGLIVGGTGFMIYHGPESWHPSPEFFFKKGAGPLFDMGPYYITALVSLLGPVASVQAETKITHRVRTITSKPLYGKKVTVEVPTHVCSLLTFASGPVVTLTTSFDAHSPALPNLELFGDKANLRLPDPNQFTGPLTQTDNRVEHKINRMPEAFQQNSRGLGLVDMAVAFKKNRPHRASGDLALHVLETMHAILKAGASGKRIRITAQVERPEPLPVEATGWFN
ncbi:MAG: Gfo/Idh/MocA family oxidoreductase [Fibrobacterota bacterium]